MLKFVKLRTDAFDIISELTPAEFKVYICMMGFIGPSDNTCFPSVQLLANKTGIARPHVSAARKGLRQKGWITPTGECENSVRLNVPLWDQDADMSAFRLTEAEKSVTKTPEIVTESVQGCTESVTEGSVLVTPTRRRKKQRSRKSEPAEAGTLFDTEPSEPKPTPKPKKAEPFDPLNVDPSQPADTWLFLVYACRLSQGYIETAKTRIGRVSAALKRDNPTNGQCLQFLDWWKQIDFRGREGQTPRLEQVLQHWGEAMSWKSPVAIHPQKPTKPTQTPLQRLQQMRKEIEERNANCT